MEDRKSSFTEKEVFQMFNDTSNLLATRNSEFLSSAIVGASNSNSLANNVEFWNWMQRNYSASGIFDSTSSMQQYIAGGAGKEGWMIKQLQGKGYEWEWMVAQRNNPFNLFNTYDAGDVANRAASDVTERSILTGKSTEYQMKAYISKANPDLHNTPKDMAVVTNAEKVDIVSGNGYTDVEGFQDAPTIKKRTQKRLDQIKKGKATPTYNIKNVAGTMARSGLIGCVIGVGTETIVSYKDWKAGRLTDDEYLTEILKAGGDAGVTAAATSGIMIPISATITAAGASALITIPVAFVVGGVVNKVVAPCFGRGDYKKYLLQAKYYQQLNLCYNDFLLSLESSSECFADYIDGMIRQNQQYSALKQIDKKIDQELKKLYDEI